MNNTPQESSENTHSELGVEPSDKAITPLPTEGEQKPQSKRWIALLVAGIAVILLGVGAALLLVQGSNQRSQSTSSQQTSIPAYLTSQDKYACALAGLTALRCQNVEDKSVVKFTLPQQFRSPYQIVPNEDASRFVIVNSANYVEEPNAGLHAYVVDRNFSIISKLPPTKLDQDGFKFAWLADGKTLVYDLRSIVDGQFGPSQLYTYDSTTGKTAQLTHTVTTVESPAVMKNGDIVAYGELGKEAGTSPEQLLIISPKDGSMRNVNYDAAYAAVGKNSARFFYEPSNGLFYSRSNTQDGKVIVARLTSASGELTLEQIAELHVNTTQFYPTVAGMVYVSNLTKDTPYYTMYTGQSSERNHLIFQRDTDNILLTTTAKPFNKPDKSPDLSKANYLYVTEDTPARLKSFLETLVTADCPAHEYSSVELYAHDGDQQAAVSQGNCGKSAMYYYIYQNGSYKQVAATQEGVDCSKQQEAGISKVILPACSDGNL